MIMPSLPERPTTAQTATTLWDADHVAHAAADGLSGNDDFLGELQLRGHIHWNWEKSRSDTVLEPVMNAPRPPT